MTVSEFDTLRSDLAAFRTDVEGRLGGLRLDIENRLAALRSDMDARFTQVDVRFARLEAKIDEKPSAATIYQAALATFAGMFAVTAGTVVVLKTIGLLP